MDPYEVLGVRQGATAEEVSAAYREQAKRWHPDRGAGDEGEARMAEINVAYDLVRLGERHGPAPSIVPNGVARPPGYWLDGAMRAALGRELLDMLNRDEAVTLVTPTSMGASPHTVLAATDRRLLWLHDDALVSRVHSLPYRNISEVHVRNKRKGASLTVRSLAGRRHVFHDLRPQTAQTIARAVRPH
jgi:hypothetical protein